MPNKKHVGSEYAARDARNHMRVCECGARLCPMRQPAAPNAPSRRAVSTALRFGPQLGLHLANNERVDELLVIIVNYRTADLAVACLRSLAPELASIRTARAVVVDNASHDGSVERLDREIASHHAGFVELLALARNRGFGSGNNAALRQMLACRPARFVCLLNPDTEVRPGALRALLDFAHDHPRAGILGSRCENADGSARASAFRFHSALGELEAEAAFGPLSRVLARYAIAPVPSASAERCDWVSGAAMLVRREVFERIGLFDEAFFLYYEETDLALRAAKAGFECWYVPASRVFHHCGQASGITGERAAHTRIPNYWYASRRHYFTKHYGRLYAVLADSAWLTGSAWRRLHRALRVRANDAPPRRFGDFVSYNLPKWVQP